MPKRVLVVTAVPAERDAVRGAAASVPSPLRGGLVPHRFAPAGTGLAVDALAAGVGPSLAAAGTATALALAADPYDLVISAGIAGGFAPAAPVGSTVVASSMVAADLGGETGEGFADAAALGFGLVVRQPPEALARAVAAATGSAHGPVLSVSTVTGTADRAAELAGRHVGAVAEAMEGFGVASAAALHGVPALEVRAVSNAVGPRDRSAWRVPEALAALTEACAALWPVVDSWEERRG
ncbi:futalosine hydrolase [Streptomyces radicis]|uniref:Futalosine hydrolase n=1 Tax=Streptomyces radicis TaxID=1750517 RepID=A0A3A9W8Q2_9ACTN|nr:futalosine hydrolase [Streptomyces radicis]RKN09671.1 futalosine hydrolase [Streptomyces radicis]RKN23309.1 futalosine hydrolase [Streptomyces radicis]